MKKQKVITAPVEPVVMLKPCPFCGSDAFHSVSTPELEVITCITCPCNMEYDGSFEALKEMWNHRST